MTPIDTDDLAPEKIGWLRAFENSKITDEELEETTADIPAPTKQPATPVPPTPPTQTDTKSPIREQLEQATQQPKVEQATFDELFPDFLPKEPRHCCDHDDDTRVMCHPGGWRKNRGREG